MFGFKNIAKGPITSLLGVLIILASVCSVFIKSLDIPWTEAVVGMTVGITLLGIQDPKLPNGGVTTLLVLGLLVVGMACRRPTVITNTVEKTFTTYRDTTVFVKGDSVKAIISQDSIFKMLLQLKETGRQPKIIIRSSSGNTDMIYKLNERSLMEVQCVTKDRLIEMLIKQVETEKSRVDKQIVTTIPEWVTFLIIVLCSIIVLETIFIVIVFKTKLF